MSGANITSDLAELLLVANAGNSAFVVNTDSTPALFVDSNTKVGVNTLTPGAQLEVESEDGACLRLRRTGDVTECVNISVNSGGDLAIEPQSSGSKITTTSSLDIVNHNGSSVGLKFGGVLVEATAAQLNTTAVTPGTAAIGKAVILDASKNISGINSISASTMAGTLTTSSQPNVTSVGTLTSLTVTNQITAGQLTGTLQTGNQPNITKVGTLDSLTVANGISASQLTGTLITGAQPNITSVGPLESLVVNGVTIGTEATFLSNATPGIATEGKAIILSDSGSISGIASLSATELIGTVQTTDQPLITRVGTLGSLTVANGITGTLQTGNQPNITHVGLLSSISIAGSTIASEAAYLSGAVAGSAASSKALVLNSAGSISGIASLSATNIIGTLSTSAQPHITSIGGLSSVTIAGATIGSEAVYLSGAVPGSATNSKVLVLNSSGSIGGIVSLSASNLTGTLQTSAQPNVTSIGTLSTLSVSGAVTISSTSNATSTTSGSVTTAGGLGVAKNLYVGAGIYGTLGTSSQPNITSVGNLSSLFIVGDLTVDGNFTVNGDTTGVSGGSGGSSAPDYVLAITPGNAAASKAVVLNSAKSVSGINSLSATTLEGVLAEGPQPNINAVGTLTNLSVSNSITTTNISGTLQTGAQENITSVGTLTSLAVTGNVSASSITGELTAGAQPNISSVGTLDSLAVSGNVSATSVTGELTTGAQPNISSVGTLDSLAVSGNVSATSVTGELTTGAQPNISSVGTLASLAVTGNVSASSITGELTTGAQPNISSVGTLDSLAVSGNVSASSITGELTAGAQPNISAVGALNSLAVTGAASIASTTNATDSTHGGALTVAGGLAIAKNAFIGQNLTVTGSVTANGVELGVPLYMDNIIPGTATASNTLVADSDIKISGLTSLSTNDFSMIGSVQSIGGVDWEAVAAPSDSWNAVCWSPELGLFVAVSDTGTNRVMVSHNGTTWISATTVVDANDWNAVCWSPELGMFVAVAASGTTQVITSVDGMVWTPVTTTILASAWQGICWSPELHLFVAIAYNGTKRVMTSSNGIDWTAISVGSNAWQSICWSPKLSKFVAVAYSGSQRVMTSSDGIVWTRHTAANDTNAWYGVCWSPEQELFVAVAYSGTNRVMTSTDGENWTPIVSASETTGWYHVCWAAELSLFVAVAFNGSARRVMTSPNGANWTARSSPNESNAWRCICWAPELSMFVAVSYSGTDRVMVSKHSGKSSLTLLKNASAAGLTNTSSLGISADVHMGYKSGLNGSHRWLNDSDSQSDIEMMRLSTTGLGIGLMAPKRKLDISSATGECLRLRNGVTKCVDLSVDSAGSLSLTTGSQQALTITADQYVGIGVDAPLCPLHVSGTATLGSSMDYTLINSNGAISATSATPTNVSIYCSGRIACVGEVDVVSDERVKGDITTVSIEDADRFINNISPKRFHYLNEPNRMNFGYIAQDILNEDISELITAKPDSSMKAHINDDGFESPAGVQFGVITGNVIPLLHLKIKQLADENVELKQVLKDALKRLSILEEK